MTMTGDQHIKSVKIDPEAFDPEDISSLEDMIQVAFTSALEKVADAQQEAQQRVVSAATGGLKLPPGFGF